jgi:acyl-CoA thioesterase FadM
LSRALWIFTTEQRLAWSWKRTAITFRQSSFRSQSRWVFTADAKGAFAICAAKGHFVHVYVDQQTRRPVQLPLNLKTVLEKIRNV